MQPENNLKPTAPLGPERLRTMEPVKPQVPAGPQTVNRPDSTYPTPIRGRLMDTTDLPPAPLNKKRFSGRWPSIISTLSLLLLAPLIAISIAAFVVQSYQVDGQSMETTLQNDDRLIVDKWPRTWSRITGHVYVPKRGHIIIFNQSGIGFAGSGTKQLIKRVVGLPGERVVISDGSITIYNGEHPEGFNPDKAGIYQISASVTPGNVDVTLKDNEIFVCGDNRANSEDSRYFGPVNVKQIVGKLSFRVIPLNKAQHF